MVLPITGPVTTTERIDINRQGSWMRTKTRWKQKAPFTEPLPYYVKVRDNLVGFGYYPMKDHNGLDARFNVNLGRGSAYYVAGEYHAGHPAVIDAINRSLNKIRNGLDPVLSSQTLGLNCLLELPAQMKTLESHLIKMARFFTAVLRKDFRGAKRALDLKSYNTPADRGGARRWATKSFADRSLEFAFGWAPLADDISNAMEVLSSPLPGTSFRYGAKNVEVWKIGPLYTNYSNGWTVQNAINHGVVRGYVGGYVEVTNPNLYLANSLGLTNLLGTVWEAAPWSFVVDYWFNVSQFLGSFTENYGLTFRGAYHGYKGFCVTSYTEEWFRYGHITNPAIEIYRMDLQTTETCTVHERRLGLPAVVLQKKRPWELSKFRAWTSASLILQRITKG